MKSTATPQTALRAIELFAEAGFDVEIVDRCVDVACEICFAPLAEAA